HAVLLDILDELFECLASHHWEQFGGWVDFEREAFHWSPSFAAGRIPPIASANDPNLKASRVLPSASCRHASSAIRDAEHANSAARWWPALARETNGWVRVRQTRGPIRSECPSTPGSAGHESKMNPRRRPDGGWPQSAFPGRPRVIE